MTDFVQSARKIVAAFALTGLCAAVPAKAPNLAPAADGIFAAFQSHPLVGIGDYHGLAQEEDFYAALVRDPRFAREVGNVVVEFGGAAYQDTIDRYLDGQDVPYAQLRKVWTEQAGLAPSGTYLGFINFFAQLRAVNAGLPAGKRIHVWLGDPAIDWSGITTRDDWLPIVRTRDTHALEVIERNILEQRKKALIIYGSQHWDRDYYREPSNDLPNLGVLLERKHPGDLFVVLPYSGRVEKSCSLRFEKITRAWPVPALASPVKGTSLEPALRPRGCHALAQDAIPYSSGRVGAERRKVAEKEEEIETGRAGDALLYLGPAATLAFSQKSPDIYLDPEFRAEMSRRTQIITGKPLSSATLEDNGVAPRFLRH